MILISLKTTIIFNFIPWLIVLLPPIILLISLIYQIIEQMIIFTYNKNLYQGLIGNFTFLIIALLFTVLKLDGFIQIKYSKLIYLLIIFEIYILYHIWKEIQNHGDFIGFFITISFFIILIMLFLYGDGIIKKLWISLIPIYLLLLIFLFFLILFFLFIRI
ncbi:hypothetical protein M0811_07360 [Anaeramoeba ignava]|uniref:Uncharacterized protein n=1 Tax=Anaeramoeba ignava TaxID=1746090 RepID=A0A9Q0LP79_ANAIG|nr:hypothetical protein M0811_07360 [Anaeramoeba ignava]